MVFLIHPAEVPTEVCRRMLVQNAGQFASAAQHGTSFIAHCHVQILVETLCFLEKQLGLPHQPLMAPPQARADCEVGIEHVGASGQGVNRQQPAKGMPDQQSVRFRTVVFIHPWNQLIGNEVQEIIRSAGCGTLLFFFRI